MSLIEESLAEAKAERRAEAKAEGMLSTVVMLVAEGLMSQANGRIGIENFVANGSVSRAQADAALAKLG